MLAPEPKGDALLVLSIMIHSCPDAEFNKDWMRDKMLQVAKHKDPCKLLTGRDYTAYMTAKDRQKWQHSAV